MAPNFNDVCLLSQCLRPINFTRKTPNHAIDQFVEGIRHISIQERSSGWLRDSFKNEFLEEETILLRALFATPFLNEDGFGDSFRHAWGKECIGFKTTITQDELTQYFPARDSPHLKPDETTQDLPFQERRHPSLQRLFVEPSLLQAELLNGMSEPKGWGRHKWFQNNRVKRVLELSEDKLLRLQSCLLLGLPTNPNAYHALLHAWGITQTVLKSALNRWENRLLNSPVLRSTPREDAHSSPSGLFSLLRSPSANIERTRKRAARSPPSTPSLRSPSPQRANRNHTPSPSTFNSSTPSRTKRILNFMRRSSPRQQESILEEQDIPAAHSSPSGLHSLQSSPPANTEKNRRRTTWPSPSTPSLRSHSPQRANRNHTPSPSTFNSPTPSTTKRILNFMRPSPRQQESILEEQELPAYDTVGGPCAQITANADEPEHNCGQVRLVFEMECNTDDASSGSNDPPIVTPTAAGDYEFDEEMECNTDDVSSGSIDPPIDTPTAAGDYECDEEMEYSADDASSGSIDPPIITPTSSANNLGASKEQYPLLSRHTSENEVLQLFEEFLAFALETNKREAVQKMISGIIDLTAKMENKNSYEAVELRARRRNGSEMVLIQIPTSSNLDRFMKLSTRTKFITKVLEAIAGKTHGIDDKDSAGWLIYYLSKHFPDQYGWVGKELDLRSVIPEMDALDTEAMWTEAGVSVRSQRSIKRSLSAHLGGQYFIASEIKTKALTSDMIKPETGHAIIDRKKVFFWTRPVDHCVIYRIRKLAFLEIEEFEIVIGGDHGQGKYGEIVKVILRAAGRKVLRTFTVKVGHIECKKDTYDIFKGTIATPLNESLKRLKGAWLKLRRCEETGYFLATLVGSPSDLSVADRADSRLVPVKLKCTGDLAYQSMKLGKVNMSGKWCPICDASPREWCKCYHHKGKPWTLKLMDETRENCDNEVCEDVPANRKGCVEPYVIDAIEVEDHIGPALHEMMGMSNDAMEQGFMEWIDQRLEEIPVEEEKAREDFWDAEHEFESTEGVYEEWKSNNNYPEAVEEWKRDIATLNIWRHLRNPPGMGLPIFNYSPADRKSMGEEIKELKEKIKNLETKHKREQEPLKRTKALRAELKQVLKKLRNERGKGSLGSKIRQQIDDCFVKYGADRAAFHGGDFPGVAILRLNEHINELFDDIQKILLEVPDRGATNEEITQQLQAYRMLFVLMDFLFSMARSPSDEVVLDLEGFLKELEEVIKETMKWWAKLGLSETTIKKHIVGAHLVDQIRLHRGIAEYYEDFVELMHQFVKMLEQRSCIRNFDVKANYQCRIEEVQNHEGVQEARKAALEVTKRNFKNPRDNRPEERAQASKETRQTRRKEIFALSKDFDDSKIPTGEALNKLDYFDEMTDPQE